MGSHHRAGGPRSSASAARLRLVGFLSERLSEDLAAIWDRDERPDRPGMAAQVEVIDDLLRALDAGRLPATQELRMLLYGYGRHPEYDPVFAELLTA